MTWSDRPAAVVKPTLANSSSTRYPANEPVSTTQVPARPSLCIEVVVWTSAPVVVVLVLRDSTASSRLTGAGASERSKNHHAPKAVRARTATVQPMTMRILVRRDMGRDGATPREPNR